MNETIIRVEHIVISYPGSAAASLNNLTFEIEKGKVIAFIGENGAGKTTLLRALGGLLDLDEGNIFFNGMPLAGPSLQLVAGHPKIKMLRQDATLSPKISVYDNIRYELKSYPMDHIRRRTEELYQLCNLKELAHKLPHELSGGERQRAALAKAMADEPELILLDEPFSNTDVMQKMETRKALINIFRNTETTLLFSTHDMEEAFSFSDQIVCMKNGAIVQMGTPEEIYNQPINPYVANLGGICNYMTTAYTPADSPPMLGVRAEHIDCCAAEEHDCVGKITEKFFIGRSNEYTLETQSQLKLIFYSPHNLSLGEEIYIKFNKRRWIEFN